MSRPALKTRAPAVRFLCDVMLGRLARWLRALGHDTAYDPAADDAELLRRAARERRMLVTRDTRIVAPPRVRVMLLRANDTPGQLRELTGALDLGGAGRSAPRAAWRAMRGCGGRRRRRSRRARRTTCAPRRRTFAPAAAAAASTGRGRTVGSWWPNWRRLSTVNTGDRPEVCPPPTRQASSGSAACDSRCASGRSTRAATATPPRRHRRP